ncbi:hypothetical protein VPH35_120519 [Triticum aestivum]
MVRWPGGGPIRNGRARCSPAIRSPTACTPPHPPSHPTAPHSPPSCNAPPPPATASPPPRRRRRATCTLALPPPERRSAGFLRLVGFLLQMKVEDCCH